MRHKGTNNWPPGARGEGARVAELPCVKFFAGPGSWGDAGNSPPRFSRLYERSN
jgi:hypothetical protein